jgi:hypothetical protein
LLKLMSIFRNLNHSPISDLKSLSKNVPEAFRDHYERIIFPQVHTFERRRIEVLKQFRKNIFLAIPISIIIINLGFFINITVDDDEFLSIIIAMFIVFCALFALWYWAIIPIKSYKSSIKDQIYPNIFSYFGPDFIYKQKSLMDTKIFSDAGVVPIFLKEKCEDYIKGSYKGASIELTEACLVTLRRRRDIRSPIVFTGYLFRLSMEQKFSGHTVVRNRKSFLNTFYSWCYKPWFPTKLSELETVRFEDPSFRREFEVRSSDHDEARYLLTDTFIERLIDLGHCFGKKAISCAFYENDLLISVKSKSNKFEVSSVFDPETFIDEIKFILKEMDIIFSMINIIEVNDKVVN